MSVTVFLGGTFNPFHICHNQMAAALNALPEIDKVYIMPDKIPPHKECVFLAPDCDRIEMCRLAAADFKKAEVLLIEFERDGKSYTFDTVTQLKKRFPDTRFFMACGGDMIASLNRWYRWEELIKEIGFYAFRREGEKGFDEAVDKLREKGAEIRVINTPIAQVSSTEIRQKLRNGENTELLPKNIQEYINKKELYYECDNS